MTLNKSAIRDIAGACRRLLDQKLGQSEQDKLLFYTAALIEITCKSAGQTLTLNQVMSLFSGANPPSIQDSHGIVMNHLREQLEVIPKALWRDKPDLAGKMHQYYQMEKKGELFKVLRGGKKAELQDIPAITQLYTPEWIARYMAENTLGRLWQFNLSPDHIAELGWIYYDWYPDEGGVSVNEQTIRPGSDPLSWRILDPACGTGVLLGAAFDVLMKIHTQSGISEATAARHIVTKQLYGLDLDPCSLQISRILLYLKAIRYDPTLLLKDLHINFAVPASLYPEFIAAGSLLKREHLLPDSEGSCILQQSYDVILTNPPYLGRRYMNDDLAAYLDLHYKDSKNDLFGAFMELALELLRPGGIHGTITQHSWMFLSGYEGLRRKLLNDSTIVSLLHLGSRAFEDLTGDVVQTTCFISRKGAPTPSSYGVYWDLTESGSTEDKEAVYISRSEASCYRVKQAQFSQLPGNRITYKLTGAYQSLFQHSLSVGQFFAVKKGMDTGENERFVRNWYEVPMEEISLFSAEPEAAVWFPYAKGGGSRPWYGNHYYVVLWKNQGEAIRQHPRSNLRNKTYYGMEGITWSTVSTERVGFRLLEEGFLFDNGGSCLFPLKGIPPEYRYSLLAYLNSELVHELLNQMNPTLNVQPGDVARLPIKEELLQDQELIAIGKQAVEWHRREWDDSEFSWHYDRHPLGRLHPPSGLLEDAYIEWVSDREGRTAAKRRLEERINRIVLRQLGLEDDSGGTQSPHGSRLQKDGLRDLVKSLISYAMGWIMGRYVTSRPTFSPTSYGYLVLQREIVLSKLRRWAAEHWGEKTAECNLRWLGNSLKRKPRETPEDRLVRYILDEFYEVHKRDYHKRPYYTVITSGPLRVFEVITPLASLSSGLLRELDTRSIDAEQSESSPERLEELAAFRLRVKNLMDLQLELTEEPRCTRGLAAVYHSILQV